MQYFWWLLQLLVLPILHYISAILNHLCFKPWTLILYCFPWATINHFLLNVLNLLLLLFPCMFVLKTCDLRLLIKSMLWTLSTFLAFICIWFKLLNYLIYVHIKRHSTVYYSTTVFVFWLWLLLLSTIDNYALLLLFGGRTYWGKLMLYPLVLWWLIQYKLFTWIQ